jgi:hypothetical protein
MGTRTYETTNAKIASVLAEVNVLIEWAEADAQHAKENGASDTAKDDRRRARNLKRARFLIAHCER